MKTLTAIFLLLLLLFNLVGYRFVFSYASSVLDKQAEVSFDHNQYDDNTTITIRVPLHLPYQTDQSTFQRVDGKININGKVYRYIKRKIVNDEVILVCVAANNAMKLAKNQNDFFKTTTGLFDNSTSRKSGAAGVSIFKLLTVYSNNIVFFNFSLFEITTSKKISSSNPQLTTCFKQPLLKPPDFI